MGPSRETSVGYSIRGKNRRNIERVGHLREKKTRFVHTKVGRENQSRMGGALGVQGKVVGGIAIRELVL